MNCENELIVCIERPNKTPSKTSLEKNAIYEKMLKKIKEKIRTNKGISKEDVDFIESLSSEKKMEIIIEYNKRTIENERLLDMIRTAGLR